MYKETNSSTNYLSDSNIAVAVESDVPRVSRETGHIQKLLAQHSEIAAHMEQRLHAVLRPAGAEQANGEAKEPRFASSPLTCDLEGFALQLTRLVDHYQDILNRLEV